MILMKRQRLYAIITIEFQILVTSKTQALLVELKSEVHCEMSGEEKGSGNDNQQRNVVLTGSP